MSIDSQYTQRKIIHVDMDAFYASVEQRDNPDLKGRPVAVGGSRERGVVAAASYEARKYGVKSAMSSKIAIQKCPDLVFVKPRFDVYKTVSLIIRSVFREYTDLIEPLALDEAFLDVTQNKKDLTSGTLIAQEIKDKIKERTGLTASAGVSYNKFLAKIASDEDKPNGLFVIPPEEALDFLERLPIGRFFGVGKVTAEKMKTLGIFYGRNLKKWSLEDLTLNFGKQGAYYYKIAQGIDMRAVNPNRERKSLGAERTFETDLEGYEILKDKMLLICEEVWRRMNKARITGRTVTLKIKSHDFQQITRSRTLNNPVLSERELKSISQEILYLEKDVLVPTRLIGVSISSLVDENDIDPQLVIEFD